jgi:chromosome segregation ATPase
MSDDMKRELNGLRTEMHEGMGEMRQEMGEFRKGMGEMRQEMGEFRKGLSESRQEIGDLRSELRHGLDDIRAIFRRTMIHVANMTGDLAGIRHELAANVATKDDISMLYDHIDDFA